jgi:hypothetical protein
MIRQKLKDQGKITWADLCPPLNRESARSNLKAMMAIGEIKRVKKAVLASRHTEPSVYKLV